MLTNLIGLTRCPSALGGNVHAVATFEATPPADSDDRATDLESHDALEGIENSRIQEINQIGEALKRIAEGTYGICAQCDVDIDPKRLKALPNATRCISCAS